MQVEWSQIPLPELVYKYRTWSNEFHRRIITHNEVYMASPLSFEDPKDCKNSIRYDLLSNEQIYEWCYYFSKRINLNFTESQHRLFAIEKFNRTRISDKVWMKEEQEKDFIAYNEREGILSLTAESSKLEMWEKYSENQKGFCVGFDPRIMFQFLGGGGKVQYVDTLPIIMPTPWNDYIEQHWMQVYFKEKKWDFEKEYRTTKFDINPLTEALRKIYLPNEAYKEIIFGKNCPVEYRREIINNVNVKMTHVIFRDFKLLSMG